MRGTVAVMAAVVVAVLWTSVDVTTASSTGCGVTAVRSGGGLPSWTSNANPPGGVPYAISTGGDVVAILFGYPLRSGHPTSQSNKILWIMHHSRDHQSLVLAARPLHRTSPTVRIVRPADSGPGEIYPSIVDVPFAGCWHMTLAWNHHRAALDLRYR